MGDGTVTIIIPTYERVGFVGAAIDSVLEQSQPRVECLVVDDGSTDGTDELLRSYAGRIRVISQENRGQAAAVNLGFAETKTEFVGVLGSDDTLMPDAVAIALAVAMDQPDAVAIHGDVDIIDGNGVFLRRYGIGNMQLRECVRWHFSPATTGLLYRKSVVDLAGGWDPRFPRGLDYEHWLRMGLHGPYAYVEATLGTYTQHPDSITGRADDETGQSREYLGTLEAFLTRPDLPSDFDDELSAEARRTTLICAGIIIGGPVNQAQERFRLEDRVAPSMTFEPGATLPGQEPSISESPDENAERTEELNVVRSERDHALADRDRLAWEIDALHSSRSWRMTAPLRRLRRRH